MNILNYEAQEVHNLLEIINKQREIMFAFEPNLEQRVKEFDIDIYEDQMLLKDFLLIRAVEEITEAYTAFEKEHYEHYLEEIVDVFNFLIETAIILGTNFNWLDEKTIASDSTEYKLPSYQAHLYSLHQKLPVYLYDVQNRVDHFSICHNNIKTDLYEIVQLIGELTNVLKLRPWRSSQYPVDLLTFRQRYHKLWEKFFSMLIKQGIGFDILSDTWSKKYQVNKFRIDSNY